MCLSIPAEVISIDKNFAKVSVGGSIYNASLQLVEDVNIGDFILLHSGFAIEKIDKEEADKTLEIYQEIRENIKKIEEEEKKEKV